jgi:GNAT superfamily N-acetyltransferase
MNSDPPLGLQRAREILGHSTRLWVGEGVHRVEDGWWAALSGVHSVDYNVVCWYRPEPAITHGLDLVKQAGIPAVQMLAGPALAAAQELSDSEWVCIGATPVMALDLTAVSDWPDDPSVSLVGLEGLPKVRRVVEETFGVTPELARVAVPDSALTDLQVQVWTLVEKEDLKSCVATITVDGVIVLWSMATPPRYQRQGLGRRLLTAVLGRVASEGASWSLCYASSQGEPLYRLLGFEVLEHWQVWSRPRWVLGRS